MLSFGIRFGQGFDRFSLIKVMQSVPPELNYDLLVVGTSPGGVACAKEASQAGKKTAIVKWKILSPAEEEGFDENLEDMAEALEVPKENGEGQMTPDTIPGSGSNFQIRGGRKKTKSSVWNISSGDSATKRSDRKIRNSRLDMNNEFFKRGQQGRKLMHNAASIRDLIEDAKNCGWRLASVTQPMTINWAKMMQHVMDYVMKENWELMKELNEENIEVIEGFPAFLNDHTVIIKSQDTTEQNISAEIICVAPSAEYVLPEDVEGANDYGITCDDFIRMSKPPGKTLVVGALPEGLECAGIIAGCQFPVTIASRSKILKGHDTEITQMIVDDLKKRGVVFLENTTVKSVELGNDEKLVVGFAISEADSGSDADSEKINKSKSDIILQTEIFDTVLFAVGRRTHLKGLRLENAKVEYDSTNEKIFADEQERTNVPNIYAIGDVTAYRPEGYEVSELAGKLLGKRLFGNGTQLMDYTMMPSAIFTPIEYAFVGISEDGAIHRFGEDCIGVYRGYFTPLEFVIPPRKGQCFAKVIVFKSTDLVIGVHIYGPDAGEAIQGFAAAIKTGVTMSKLQTVVGVPATRVQKILKFKEAKNEDIETGF